MSSGGYFYLIAAVLYLSECVVWVPRGRLGLVSRGTGSFQLLDSNNLFGNERGGLYFAFPLPPLGRLLLLPDQPLCPSGHQIKETRGRIELWQSETRLLHLLCNLLWAYLFTIVPAVALSRGLVASWLPLLTGLLLLEFAVASEFFFAHHVLFPGKPWSRVGRILILLVSPPACIRADDSLGRTVLGSAPPLVAAALLCPRGSVSIWARRLLYDANLLLPTDAAAEADLNRLLELTGQSIAALREPPTNRDGSALSYCPRCHAQFTLATANCPDCSLPTQPFPPSASASAYQAPAAHVTG